MWKEECEIVLSIIIVVVDVEELERKKPASLPVEGPQHVVRSRATFGFSGHWAALGGRRSDRGVDAREERREWD